MPDGRSDVVELSLGGGVLTLDIPADWQGGVDGFDEAHFRCGASERLGVSVLLECFEVPDEIRENRIDRFILEKDMPRPEITPETDMTAWSVRYSRVYDDRPLREYVWRRAHVVQPAHLRIATWILSVAGADPDDANIDDYCGAVETIVEHARFADEALPADRIAPSHALKCTGLWDRVLIRVPVEWSRERQHADGTGMYCLHEEGEESGTLWVDFDGFRTPGPEVGPSELLRLAGETAKKLEAAAETESAGWEEYEGGYLVYRTFHSVEDGERLRHYAWHRFASQGPEILVVHFTLVFLERLADQPAFQQRRALFDREVKNAVLLFPQA